MRPTLIIVVAGFAALPIISGSGCAQANRTFVSGHGSDTNPCSLSAPCRSFAQALTQTNAGGEIAVLDTAGYGTVTITKSVSIINQDGVEAGVTTSSATDGIDINIGASDVVNLRGLTLVGGGVGINGIAFDNLGALNIQNCVIRGFTGSGIVLVPQGSAAFNVSDTIVANTGVSAFVLQPTGLGASITALFNRVQAIAALGNGFLVNGENSTGAAVNVTIANSTASNNAIGIQTESSTGQSATQVMVTNSVVANNGDGILQNGQNSTTYLAKNTIAGNGEAFVVIAGALFSFGDNDIRSNGGDGGAIPLVATK